MNEVLRILDKLIKKQGYAIKKHPEYNLLPIKNNGFDDQNKIYESFNSSNKNNLDNSDNIDRLEVCLRTCINDRRAKSKRSELTNVSLEEHLLKCIKSLFISINEASKQDLDISLTVFDDRSNADTLEKITQLCKEVKCNWQIVTTDRTGQGESLYQHFAYAKDKNALFYFCEDDYLHETAAIQEMMGFYKNIYKQTSEHILIHPQEHEMIYSEINYPSYIVLGENRRWRTMSNATHTFLTHSSVVKKFWDYFENTKYVGIKAKRHLGSEKKTTDRLFKHIHGFSPIPAVAIHFQSKDCLPPFYDWKALWDKVE
tara:strand:- start:34162 stop:35103 length:942 start_codon:yes stop_codon:yes gene_type:complete